MATSNEYSFDLRLKIVQAYENKEGSQAKLARDFRVSKRTVGRLWKLYQQSKSTFKTALLVAIDDAFEFLGHDSARNLFKDCGYA